MSDSRMHPLGLGDRGPAVADVQAALRSLELLPAGPDAGEATAVYDEATELAVRHFQQVRGLSVDGRVGEETYRALSEARWSLGDRLLRYDPERLTRGDDVTNLQDRLHELRYDAGPVDGVFGPETEAGLRAFQRDYGLTADGTCGPATLRALKQLGRRVTGGGPQAPRAGVRSCCGRAPRWWSPVRTSSAGSSSSTPGTAARRPGTRRGRPPRPTSSSTWPPGSRAG